MTNYTCHPQVLVLVCNDEKKIYVKLQFFTIILMPSCKANLFDDLIDE